MSWIIIKADRRGIKLMEAKRIKFERTGGFAGIRLAADIKLDELPEDQAQQILELLDDLDFDKLPEQMMSDRQIPDSFTYSVTVISKGQQHTVTTNEASAPEKMGFMFQILIQIARQQARNKK